MSLLVCSDAMGLILGEETVLFVVGVVVLSELSVEADLRLDIAPLSYPAPALSWWSNCSLFAGVDPVVKRLLVMFLVILLDFVQLLNLFFFFHLDLDF